MFQTLKDRFPDKGALVAAIALSCISVLAIPFIYLLIVKARHKERKYVQARLDAFSRAKSEGYEKNVSLPLKREKEE